MVKQEADLSLARIRTEGRKMSELIWDERMQIKARNSVKRQPRGPGLNQGGGGVPTFRMEYNKRSQEE